MKKSILLAVAALTPLTLSAQNPTAASGGGIDPNVPATVAPATSPAAPRLPAVQFDGHNLKEVIQALQEHCKEAGLDPATDPMNIVISPGLEQLQVPALSLRNVTPTEVLSVATTVLGLRMEPVMGDDGNRVVAWLIKRQEVGADPFGGGGGNTTAPPPAASPQPAPIDPGTAPVSSGLGSATASSFNPVAGPATGGGGFAVPAPVAIAGTSPFIGGPAAAPQTPAVRVFGIAPLLAVTSASGDERLKERAGKFERLIHTLNRLSNDQSIKTDIAAYEEMDIIVVKCADSTGMELIAEAIEAMKSNVGQAKSHDPIPRGTGSR